MVWTAICIYNADVVSKWTYRAETFQEARKKLIENEFSGGFWSHLYEDRDSFDDNHPRIQKYSTVEPNFFRFMMSMNSEEEFNQIFKPFFSERAPHLAIEDLRDNGGLTQIEFYYS